MKEKYWKKKIKIRQMYADDKENAFILTIQQSSVYRYSERERCRFHFL